MHACCILYISNLTLLTYKTIFFLNYLSITISAYVILHDTKYIDHYLCVSIQHAPTDLTREIHQKSCEIQQKRDELRNLVSKAVQKKAELYDALGKADKNCETLGKHDMLPLALQYLSR